MPCDHIPAVRVRQAARTDPESSPQSGSDDGLAMDGTSATTSMVVVRSDNRLFPCSVHDRTMMALSLIDAFDPDIASHSRRIALVSMRIGRRLRMPEPVLDLLYRASLLHDIGKICIPRAILACAERLTDERLALMRSHVSLGAAMVKRMVGLDDVAVVIRSHHERYDGQGYPDGLAGNAIPIESRIIAAADAYDAMTSHRPYRVALPHAIAVDELRRGRASQWDPHVIDALLEELRRMPLHS